MSFKLYNTEGIMVAEVERGSRIALSLPRSYVIEPVSFAVINHHLRIQIEERGLVMIVRAPGIMETYRLLVDQGPLANGSIKTTVFNLSDRRAHIDRSEVLSWLMEI